MRATSCPILFSLALLSVLFSPAGANSWYPIKREDLALKEGRVEADADAEAIEWEIIVSDEWSGPTIRSSVSQHYSVKIFNARGREAYSRVDIPYERGTDVIDIAARTIKPDGSVIQIKKDAILERTVSKGAGTRKYVKSFAMPGVEPGCIVEYQWTAVRYDQLTHNLRVDLQLDIPVELLRFSIHPLPVEGSRLQMRIRAFNFALPTFADEPSGFHSMTLPSIHGLKKEPHMAPSLSLRPWIAIYYQAESEFPVTDFWKRFGKGVYEGTRPFYRASDDVKSLTKTVLAGATDQDVIAERLMDYCRTKIRNADLSDSGLTADQRKWLRSDHSASEYLKRGIADDDGVRKMFLAMASAAGLDARLALLPDRSECVFNSSIPAYYLLNRGCIAVQVLGTWRAFDPTAADLPSGMLPWWIQGVDMLVPDPETPVFVRTPISSPEQSLKRRIAHLKLSEDGTVEGDVTGEFAGQHAAEWRRDFRDLSAVEREKILTDGIKARMSTAEVSQIHFNPGVDPSEPFRLGFHVRVPGYAQRTGKRLILKPAFFERGEPALFSSRERRYPVSFHYPWSENDMVLFELPEHFHLETPPDLKPIMLPNLGMHSVRIKPSDDGRQLQVLHSLIFGEGGITSFPVEEYPKLKEAFDQFQSQDESTLSLVSDESTVR